MAGRIISPEDTFRKMLWNVNLKFNQTIWQKARTIKSRAYFIFNKEKTYRALPVGF